MWNDACGFRFTAWEKAEFVTTGGGWQWSDKNGYVYDGEWGAWGEASLKRLRPPSDLDFKRSVAIAMSGDDDSERSGSAHSHIEDDGGPGGDLVTLIDSCGPSSSAEEWQQLRVAIRHSLRGAASSSTPTATVSGAEGAQGGEDAEATVMARDEEGQAPRKRRNHTLEAAMANLSIQGER